MRMVLKLGSGRRRRNRNRNDPLGCDATLERELRNFLKERRKNKV